MMKRTRGPRAVRRRDRRAQLAQLRRPDVGVASLVAGDAVGSAAARAGSFSIGASES